MSRKFKVTVRKQKAGLSEREKAERQATAIANFLRRVPLFVWFVLALGAAALWFGTPHILVTYEYVGRSGNHTRCDYFGVQGWRNGLDARQGRCNMVRLLPLQF